MTEPAHILASAMAALPNLFHGTGLLLIALFWAVKASVGYGLFRVIRARRSRALPVDVKSTRLPPMTASDLNFVPGGRRSAMRGQRP